MRGNDCAICSRLRPEELLELDLLVGDPTRWPSTVWGIFNPPRGGLPASYRRFGAVRMGRDWLDRHGYADMPTVTLRRHVRFDVVHKATDTADLVELGVIAVSDSRTRIPVNPQIDATAVIEYFNAGVQMGGAALRMAAERINAMADAGIPIDTKTLLEMAKLGTRLATTQASLQVRGAKFTHGGEDEDEHWRGSADNLPSTRIQHHRIRNIDGEVRPVLDEGPADREDYNERARREGSPLLD